MPDPTTWTALLAHWTEMVKIARALDGHAEAPLARAMPDIITCQALAHALPELDDLTVEQRSLALDRAGVMVGTVEGQMEDGPVHEALDLAFHEAQAALEDARLACAWMLVWDGPDSLEVPAPPEGVPARGDVGTLLLALPGTIILPGTPVGWWTQRHEPMLSHFVPGMLAQPHARGLQVWRTLDDAGCWVKDTVLPIDTDGPDDAIPLLVPRLVDGHVLPTLDPVPAWVSPVPAPGSSAQVSWPSP
ncbi:MAG: hypothetical protein MK074_08940 [Phycisphaerales bacterium]|nr:hypothetical protein [Phycisphaerales bacterium]